MVLCGTNSSSAFFCCLPPSAAETEVGRKAGAAFFCCLPPSAADTELGCKNGTRAGACWGTCGSKQGQYGQTVRCNRKCTQVMRQAAIAAAVPAAPTQQRLARFVPPALYAIALAVKLPAGLLFHEFRHELAFASPPASYCPLLAWSPAGHVAHAPADGVHGSGDDSFRRLLAHT